MISVDKSGSVPKINLYGVVHPSYWWGDFNLEDVKLALGSVEHLGPVEVHIHSVGGDCLEGLAVYRALKDHKPGCTTRCDGLVASAASLIFCAGSERIMPRESYAMVHQVRSWLCATWTSAQMRKEADLLDKLSSTYAGVYSRTSGKPQERWDTLMAEESWLTADEAEQLGLCTAVVDDATTQESAGDLQLLPPAPDKTEDLPDPPVELPAAVAHWYQQRHRRVGERRPSTQPLDRAALLIREREIALLAL